MKLIIPQNYKTFDVKETEFGIKAIKDFFERALAQKLNLTRVSAPRFIEPETGLNDNLNGVERPVSFDVPAISKTVEVVHSLAKWKRDALFRYDFPVGEGLYTDMDAIRRDEELDNLHSVYVDQWDWEKVINKNDRNEKTMEDTVKLIFEVYKESEKFICSKFPSLQPILPEKIEFVTTYELEELYPENTPKEREDIYARKHKAIFIKQIGGKLKSGEKHDGRAPDYDDWNLNGDIIFYDPILDIAFEVSSMGIRVDEDVLEKQLDEADCNDRKAMEYHQNILTKKLPYTIGGGIGQSRTCMFLLQKAHIGEVQVSVWPPEMKLECAKAGVNLL